MAPSTPPPSAARRWRGTFLIAISLTTLGAAATHWGWPALREWQVRRGAAVAEALLKQGDLQGANLAARQALSLNAQAIRPLKVMASIASQTGSPDAVTWQQMACDAPGASGWEWLDLARIAHGFGETALAEQALDRAPEPIQNTAAWHEVAGLVAIQAKRLAEAETHYREALRLAPGESVHRLNLAAVQLASRDPAVAAQARAVLESLASDRVHARAALRNLLDDARRQHDRARAKRWAEALGKAPGASFADRLELLDEFRASDEERFRAAIASMQKEATGDPSAIVTLMRWMNDKGLERETLAWFHELPPKANSHPSISIAAAKACVKCAQWDTLSEVLLAADWGPMEFLRHAYRARAQLTNIASPRGAAFKSHWERAVYATSGKLGALTMLARCAEKWGWQEEAANVWWLVARRPIGQRTALKALFALYRSSGNTAKLYEVARRIYQAEPQNPIAKNNVAMFALLLGRDLPEAYALAASVHSQVPGAPAIASTQAFSLLRQGRTSEALAVMESLPAKASEDSSINFYRALVLAAAGRADEVEPVLKAAQENSALLPEEKAFARSLLGSP